MIDALSPIRRLSRTSHTGPDALPFVRWEPAWAASRGEGVTIGLLDGPIDAGHPDLAGAALTVRDFTTQSGRAASPRHATCSATALLGQGRRIIRGIVPRARLCLAIVVSPEGIAGHLAVASAIDWLAATGARLIMMPIGGTRASRAVGARIRAAADAGVPCFAAYGNAASPRALFPARHPSVLSVAAADAGGALAFVPSRACPPDLIAPGWNIEAAVGHRASARVSGSSLATVLAGGLTARAIASIAPGARALRREALLALLLGHSQQERKLK